MAKKKNKKKEKLKCIDCEELSDDYYQIATNRGYIIKCVECYELWLWRSSRVSYGLRGQLKGGNSSLQEDN